MVNAASDLWVNVPVEGRAWCLAGCGRREGATADSPDRAVDAAAGKSTSVQSTGFVPLSSLKKESMTRESQTLIARGEPSCVQVTVWSW